MEIKPHKENELRQASPALNFIGCKVTGFKFSWLVLAVTILFEPCLFGTRAYSASFFGAPEKRDEQGSGLLAIPTGNLLLHGQYRLSGRFQYFTNTELGATDTVFEDPADTNSAKEIQTSTYSSELLFGIENRAEIGFQYGQNFSLSAKALLIREDIMLPDVLFGVRSLFGSQEAGLYAVTNSILSKKLESESFLTLAKSYGPNTRLHVGASILPYANTGLVSMNIAVEQNLGKGAHFGYEVFERFSDFHQILSFQWKYHNLVGLTLGMTEFQSWVRQGGRWGFFLTPSHPQKTGYNSPGISVSLQVLSWMPHREKRTLPERVSNLEMRNAELEKEVFALEDLRHQIVELKEALAAGDVDSSSIEDSVSLPPPNSPQAKAMARGKLKTLAEKMASDLGDPEEIQNLIGQIIALGMAGKEILNQASLDENGGNLRVPAILVMGASKDSSHSSTLQKLNRDVDPRIRREALTAMVKVNSRLALDEAKKLLSDPDETVAMAAGDAYRQITGQVAPASLYPQKQILPKPKSKPTPKK